MGPNFVLIMHILGMKHVSSAIITRLCRVFYGSLIVRGNSLVKIGTDCF